MGQQRGKNKTQQNQLTNHSSLKTIKVFHEHVHFIIKMLLKKKVHKQISNLEFEFVPSTTHMHLCIIRDPPTITLAHKFFLKKNIEWIKNENNTKWKQKKINRALKRLLSSMNLLFSSSIVTLYVKKITHVFKV